MSLAIIAGDPYEWIWWWSLCLSSAFGTTVRREGRLRASRLFSRGCRPAGREPNSSNPRRRRGSCGCPARCRANGRRGVGRGARRAAGTGGLNASTTASGLRPSGGRAGRWGYHRWCFLAPWRDGTADPRGLPRLLGCPWPIDAAALDGATGLRLRTPPHGTTAASHRRGLRTGTSRPPRTPPCRGSPATHHA